jgi:phosphate transport system substrate-binding protein
MKISTSRILLTAVMVGCFGMVDGSASAETLRIQGSVGFANQVLVPYQEKIEHQTSHRLVVATSRAGLALLALFAGEADLAMVSAQPEEVVALLRKTRPDLPFHRLRSFFVVEGRIAFPVNPNNPVRRVPVAKLRQVLTGQIDNWLDLGGPDLPIRVVSVTDGSGTRLTTQEVLLGGGPIAASSETRVANSDDVAKTVAEDRGALGITQAVQVRRYGLPELNAGTFVAQPLYLVSLDEPTSAMREVIAATRRVNFDDNP